MKAIRLSQVGGPEVLQVVELPVPRPGPGEVLVKAHAVGVGVPDVLVRTGRYAWMPPLPAIPGIEMSGHVVETGADISTLKAGDPVWVSARELAVRGGCYAEYICVPERAVYRLPQGVDLDAAAGLSNYQLAWHLLNTATQSHAYHSAVIWAAAGGVGTALVQLASQQGKRVIGVASGGPRCDAVRAQGADACIDRRSEDPYTAIRTLTAHGADLVLDPLGGHQLARHVATLAPLGMVINYGLLDGPPHASYADALTARFGDAVALRFFSMHVLDGLPDRRRAATETLLALLAEKRIRPVIGARVPLEDAAQAHRMLESGQVCGKILLKPAG